MLSSLYSERTAAITSWRGGGYVERLGKGRAGRCCNQVGGHGGFRGFWAMMYCGTDCMLEFFAHSFK